MTKYLWINCIGTKNINYHKNNNPIDNFIIDYTFFIANEVIHNKIFKKKNTISHNYIYIFLFSLIFYFFQSFFVVFPLIYCTSIISFLISL